MLFTFCIKAPEDAIVEYLRYLRITLCLNIEVLVYWPDSQHCWPVPQEYSIFKYLNKDLSCVDIIRKLNSL